MSEITERPGDDDIHASIQAVLEAVENLGEDLSSRESDDMSFRVKVPSDPPAVRVLAELINGLGEALDTHHQKLSREMEEKTQALSEAYNALQARNEEIQHELSMARDIQARLLPGADDFPQRDELGCAGYYRSMTNIGGDLYDIIRVGKNAYGILIADVAGHGIPAALITALVKTSFRAKAVWGAGPARICQEVNEGLHPMLSGLDHFVTVWFGIIDLEKGLLEYCNCGHHPALLVRPGVPEPVSLDTRGRFLGIFEDIGCSTGQIELQGGDTVFLFTDGIIEARNFFDEEYGQDRLVACLSSMGLETAEGVIDGIHKDLEDFCMGADQRDDQSMFAVQYSGSIGDLLMGGMEDTDDFGAVPGINPAGMGETAQVRRVDFKALTGELRSCLAKKEYRRALGVLDVLDLLLPGRKDIEGLKARIVSMTKK